MSWDAGGHKHAERGRHMCCLSLLRPLMYEPNTRTWRIIIYQLSDSHKKNIGSSTSVQCVGSPMFDVPIVVRISKKLYCQWYLRQFLYSVLHSFLIHPVQRTWYTHQTDSNLYHTNVLMFIVPGTSTNACIYWVYVCMQTGSVPACRRAEYIQFAKEIVFPAMPMYPGQEEYYSSLVCCQPSFAT